jgi:RimJ/RimL family protein N-acetyltransferase
VKADFLLETDRLRLRPYRREDVDDLLGMFSDPEHMRFYPTTLDRAGTEAWLERQFERYAIDGYGLWIAERRSDGVFVGTVGPALQEVEGERQVEIGWHVRPGLKGRGYAPEAGAAARDWVFATLGVDHLISLILPENAPSARVAEKLGMHVWKEADFKGLVHRVYRIERDEATIAT